jgi:hypothetical protein
MTVQTINIGNIVNDGLGDDLRTAFQKVNANFTELNASLTVTASNVGQVGEGVFKQKNGLDLEFKKLVAGTKMQLLGSVDNILINNTAPDAFTNITTNVGSVSANSYPNITIQGDQDVQVSTSNGVITVATILDLNQILKVLDFGPIDGQYDNNVQFNTATLNVDFGTFTLPANLNVDLGVL